MLENTSQQIGSTFGGEWKHLKFWQSGEWQVIEERYDDRTAIFNPDFELLFRSLDVVPFLKVKAVIIGQDPYPQSKFCTGIAFSIPKQLRKYPPSLETIYGELWDDLRIKRANGCLVPWCEQGVLLWNAIPSCLAGAGAMSHDWTEWSYLTQEIISKLAERGCVFAFLGSVARRYAKYVNTSNNAVIETGHPSPRGNMSARCPFTGSRLFSTINGHLNSLGHSPVDWS